MICSSVEEAKRELADVLKLREDIARNENKSVEPSRYWKDYIKYFSYVSDLSDESLKHIRLHTYHLTSDNYQRYFFGGDDDRDIITKEYLRLSKKLNRSDISETDYGIGYHVDGKVTSWDLNRYLSVASDIYDSGVMDDGAKDIVEIGGGYGGLSYVMMSLYKNISYSIIDLEETLLFSYVYLSENLGKERVHIVRDPKEDKREKGHVYLFPQCLLEKIDMDYHLAINHQSMQEMTYVQLNRYLRFMASHCQFFYSRNMRNHSYDVVIKKGLVSDVASEIFNRFPEYIWASNAVDRRTDHAVGDDFLPGIVFKCQEKCHVSLVEPYVSDDQSAYSESVPIRSYQLHKPTMQGSVELSENDRVTFDLDVDHNLQLLGLSLPTFGKTIPLVSISSSIFDNEEGIWRSMSRYKMINFQDWEEIVLDFRGVGEKLSRAKICLEINEITPNYSLGLGLFFPEDNCRLATLNINGSLQQGLTISGRAAIC